MRSFTSQNRLSSDLRDYSLVAQERRLFSHRLRDIADEDDVRVVVEDFYAKAQRDALLADALASVEGHAEKIISALSCFWSSLLFSEPSYHGDACPMHDVPHLDAAHFERWSELFIEAVEAHFSGEMVNEFKAWVLCLHDTFQKKLSAESSPR